MLNKDIHIIINMDLSTTPDIYTPNVDDHGNYIDHIPIIKNGIYCPCGARKDKSYDSPSKFSVHTKTKCHQNWLFVLNQNKSNHYMEMLKYKDIVESQYKLINDYEKNMYIKTRTIDHLTEKIDELKSRLNPNVMEMEILHVN